MESIVSHFAQCETGRLEREWGRYSLSHRGRRLYSSVAPSVRLGSVQLSTPARRARA